MAALTVVLQCRRLAPSTHRSRNRGCVPGRVDDRPRRRSRAQLARGPRCAARRRRAFLRRRQSGRDAPPAPRPGRCGDRRRALARPAGGARARGDRLEQGRSRRRRHPRLRDCSRRAGAAAPWALAHAATPCARGCGRRRRGIRVRRARCRSRRLEPRHPRGRQRARLAPRRSRTPPAPLVAVRDRPLVPHPDLPGLPRRDSC